MPQRQHKQAPGPEQRRSNHQPESIEIYQLGSEHFRCRLLGYLQDCMQEVYSYANISDLVFLTEMLGTFHGELDKQTARFRLADRALYLLLGCELPAPLA